MNEQKTRVIVVTSGKGGVGKTTLTANIGMSLARLGQRVVLLDADIGLRNLDLLLGLEKRIVFTAMDVFNETCTLEQALVKDKTWSNLSLLAISKTRQRYNISRSSMNMLVESLQQRDYNFILIDCPAGIDIGFLNAISPASEAILITTPEITAIRDADRVIGLLEANNLFDNKLIINRVRTDMIKGNNMLAINDVQDLLGIPLLGVIPEDNQVIVATNRGKPLVSRKRLTLSGLAMENAAQRLLGMDEALINLETPYKSPFQFAKNFLLNNK